MGQGLSNQKTEQSLQRLWLNGQNSSGSSEPLPFLNILEPNSTQRLWIKHQYLGHQNHLKLQKNQNLLYQQNLVVVLVRHCSSFFGSIHIFSTVLLVTMERSQLVTMETPTLGLSCGREETENLSVFVLALWCPLSTSGLMSVLYVLYVFSLSHSVYQFLSSLSSQSPRLFVFSESLSFCLL